VCYNVDMVKALVDPTYLTTSPLIFKKGDVVRYDRTTKVLRYGAGTGRGRRILGSELGFI
jgi:hypothetical protein